MRDQDYITSPPPPLPRPACKPAGAARQREAVPGAVPPGTSAELLALTAAPPRAPPRQGVLRRSSITAGADEGESGGVPGRLKDNAEKPVVNGSPNQI